MFGAISIAGVMPMAGCESLGFGDTKQTDLERQRASEERRERERVPERPTDRDVNGPGHAARDGPSALPQDAHKVGESDVAEGLRYRAEGHGRVYVCDVDANRVVYAGRVRPDDLLVLDPLTGLASVNRRPVAVTSPLSDAHSYTVYFQKD
jgi:hypothetical protein